MRHHLKRYNYAAHGAYCNCSLNAGGIASDIAGAYSANRRDHTGEHRRIFDQYGKYSEYWNRGLNMLNQFSRTQLLIGQKGMEGYSTRGLPCLELAAWVDILWRLWHAAVLARWI